MKVDVMLAEPIYLKVVEHADFCIGSLTDINCLINEVVDLLGNSLTAHSKYSVLSWCEEVYGTRLLGVIRIPAGPYQTNNELRLLLNTNVSWMQVLEE